MRIIIASLLLLRCFVFGQVELCQSNCQSSDRITGLISKKKIQLFIFIFHYYLRKGPTKMTDTRPHPWKIALFPSTNGGFCKLGCQLFYVEV